MSDLSSSVADRAQSIPEWYHSIELAPGLVTPGWFDTRMLPARIDFPDRLDGMRCLDVGSFDGFWAFEMERRGAAEVVAVDLLDPHHWDWPAGALEETIAAIGARKGRGDGFNVARDALGSAVERHELSVYDLNPAELGQFDFVYIGSLLLHLRNPVGALEAAHRVCSGQAMVVDAIDPLLTRLSPRRPVMTFEGVDRPWWWKPNLAGLARLATSAGFLLTARPRPVRIPAGAGQARPGFRAALGELRTRHGRETLLRAYVGDPHGVVHLRAG